MLDVGLTDDLTTCHALRRTVFIEEQQVAEALEVDGRDSEALHLLARLDGQAVGCARILLEGEVAKIGRVCVLRACRGQGIGQALMRRALDVLRDRGDVRLAKLGSQVHALGFYAALGFTAIGPDYMEAGIAHRDMVFDLSA
jgi:ElaA protein